MQKEDRLPLIVKGARQIGKTKSIETFGKANYKNMVEINFALQKQYKSIFDDGFEVEKIIKNITLIDPSKEFIPGETLLFFDEIQDCINCATSLKSFKLDGRYDVICSGSLMGINYNEIESNSVGYKEDYEMHSLDFEEFLWAKGYSEGQVEEFYQHMVTLLPFSQLEYDVPLGNFREYMVIEEDITKYANGLDKGKILNVYRKIPVFLGKENKKFQITKVAHNARNRDYGGTVEWLENAGIINVCYCMAQPELPLKGNYNPDNYKLYFGDIGLLIASLDDEVQNNLRANKNFNTYKGAIYENVVADKLKKQGYHLYFYRDERGAIEIDFLVRDSEFLVPVEVKADDNMAKSFNKMIDSSSFGDVKYVYFPVFPVLLYQKIS